MHCCYKIEKSTYHYLLLYSSITLFLCICASSVQRQKPAIILSLFNIKHQNGCQSAMFSAGSTFKIHWVFVSIAVVYNPTRFHEIRFETVCVIQLTDKQTERWTDMDTCEKITALALGGSRNWNQIDRGLNTRWQWSHFLLFCMVRVANTKDSELNNNPQCGTILCPNLYGTL